MRKSIRNVEKIVHTGVENAMYILFALVLLPFVFAMIWFKVYKIIVDNSKIVTINYGKKR